MKNSRLILLLCTLFWWVPMGVFAAPMLILDPKVNQYSLGLELLHLEQKHEEKNQQWTIQDIISPQLANRFNPVDQETLNFAFTDSTHWIKLRIKNPDNNRQTRLLEVGNALIDVVELYVVPDGSAGIQQTLTGESLPFASRPIQHVNFVFEVILAPHQSLTLYLKVKSQDPLFVPLTLWSEDKFYQQTTKRTLAFGLYYGIVLSMMLYNGFIFLSMRDKSYLYYVLFNLFFIFYVLCSNGLAFQYLWPQSPRLATHITPLFGALTVFWALIFSQAFLQLKTHSARLNRCFSGMRWLLALQVVATLVVNPATGFLLNASSQFVVVLLILLAGVHTVRRGYRPAQFFLLAWSALMISTVIRGLLVMDLIPHHVYSEFGPMAGSAFEVILLSLALADRIKLLQQQLTEKDQRAKTNAIKAQRNAEQASLSKSTFIANVSHEIRTPLNVVLGFAQILERDPSLSTPHRKKIETIEKFGHHLMALINDILDISKIEANAMKLQTVDFELTSLLKGIAVMFGGHCQHKHLKWTLDNQCEGLIPVRGDQGKLRQILINLLGNAIKFTPAGSVTLRVSSTKTDHYCLEVIDSGIGISPHLQQTIFEVFSQTDEGAKHGGTGLGLTIAHEQVKLMGGQLQLASTPGQGCRFYFTLPLLPAQNPIESRHNRKVQTIHLASGDTLRAMVIDDIKENRDILEHMLGDVGIVVSLADDGKQALEKLHQCEPLPQLVFMDIRLPLMNGITTLRNIHSDFKDRCPTCIVVTAHALQPDIDQYLHEGFDHYIAKPFRFEAIYECIHHLLAVDFEYRQSPDEDSELALDTLNIPSALYRSLKRAAADYEVSALETGLEALAQRNEQSRQLAELLSQYVSDYDMEGLLGILEQVGKNDA
ncbi:MAG: response regulator [Algicola sp.]|nr:response regulator [Algicola sp.]